MWFRILNDSSLFSVYVGYLPSSGLLRRARMELFFMKAKFTKRRSSGERKCTFYHHYHIPNRAGFAMKWHATFFKAGDGVAEVYCQSKAIWRARGDVCKS